MLCANTGRTGLAPARSRLSVVTRRNITLLTGVLLIIVLGTLGGVVQVPYVALGPGPTFNTLGAVNGKQVVDIEGTQTFPTQGNLNMTTVAVNDSITLFGAVGLWVSGSHALVPRSEVYPPQKTPEEVRTENTQAFAESENSAETAALSYLHFPTQVKVGALTKGSPSDGVLQPGDQLVSVDGKLVVAAEQVLQALADRKPGEQAVLSYRRNGGPPTTATITLGKRPDADPRGFLGITPSNAPDVNFTIDFNLADVGGPSAGLMFSLAVVDKLSTGKLNDGKFVAGTGTIDGSGTVGPIGGIPFKMMAAREAGATVFLVPAANCAEALQRAPDGLRLVKVQTLATAVDALQTLTAGGDAPHC